MSDKKKHNIKEQVNETQAEAAEMPESGEQLNAQAAFLEIATMAGEGLLDDVLEELLAAPAPFEGGALQHFAQMLAHRWHRRGDFGRHSSLFRHESPVRHKNITGTYG